MKISRGRAPPFGRGVLPALAYVRVKKVGPSLCVRGFAVQLPGPGAMPLLGSLLLSRIVYSAADGRPFGREQDAARYVGRGQHGWYPDRMKLRTAGRRGLRLMP